ncbi:MAG: N-acetylmuramoyl-L-alanine amidase [Candidatus Omnitrophica bacterium]|nr:N-acetylmuramoyl-L-alanine amidase [Candidatus Omnitrophota bacterium]
MRNNNLCTSKLKIGQTLKILDAAPIRPVVPLYPCAKWKYIIIHHSATDTGNALSFNRSHNARGFENGLGYHFVIDNGTKGKNNGQIEVSGRWIKQQNGAHCKAANMNTKAIGVCLVGNFSEDRVSAKQLKSLAYLVNRLRRYYRIPKSRIIGHGRVKSARTECPGKKFPWQEFWSKLKSDI